MDQDRRAYEQASYCS